MAAGHHVLTGHFVLNGDARTVVAAWLAQQPAENKYDRRDNEWIAERIGLLKGNELSLFEEKERSSYAIVERRTKFMAFIAEHSESGEAAIYHSDGPYLTRFRTVGGKVTREDLEGTKARVQPRKDPVAEAHFRSTLERQVAALDAMSPSEKFEEWLVRDARELNAVFLTGGSPEVVECAYEMICSVRGERPRLIRDVMALPVAEQTALLHELREGTANVVCAAPSMESLHEAVRFGRFREDLFYRLTPVELDLNTARP